MTIEVGMTEWAYKATPGGVSLEQTRALLEDHGFLCRTAHNSDGKLIANVKRVAMNDLIHVYYVDGDIVEKVGAFEVSSPHKLGRDEDFGRTVTHTTIRVAKGALAEHVASLGGYEEDPKERGYTGWSVKPSDAASSDYDSSLFRGQNALVAL